MSVVASYTQVAMRILRENIIFTCTQHHKKFRVVSSGSIGLVRYPFSDYFLSEVRSATTIRLIDTHKNRLHELNGNSKIF